MGRILALDVGDARIGLAVSDLMGIIANPLQTYHRVNIDSDVDYIIKVARDNEVELVVSGMPLSMNGNENAQTVKTRDFIDQFSKKSPLPVKFIDERLTTVSAERVLIEGNVRRENRKGVIDKVAATIILQNYLDYYKK